MNVHQIKAAVDEGLPVRWSNDGYHVYKDGIGQYLITFEPNGHTIGLTWMDGETLNGDEADFYVKADEA